MIKVWFFTIAVLLTAACSEDSDDDHGKKQQVAVLLPDASIIDRWAVDKSHLETVMNMYGFNTTFYTAPESEEGALQQVDQLETAIKNGAKVVVLTAIDYQKINESGVLAQS